MEGFGVATGTTRLLVNSHNTSWSTRTIEPSGRKGRTPLIPSSKTTLSPKTQDLVIQLMILGHLFAKHANTSLGLGNRSSCSQKCNLNLRIVTLRYEDNQVRLGRLQQRTPRGSRLRVFASQAFCFSPSRSPILLRHQPKGSMPRNLNGFQ